MAPSPGILWWLAVAGCASRSPEAVVAAPVVDEERVAALVREGDARWLGRADPAELAASQEAWTAALALDPTDRSVLLRVAHGAWLEGFLADDPAVAQLRWQEAEDAGARCEAADPHAESAAARGLALVDALPLLETDTLECAYWRARALEDRSWARSPSLGLRAAPDVEARMAEVARRTPGLDGHGPVRWEAAHFARLPTFAGRDLPRAVRALASARTLEPDLLEPLLSRAAYLDPALGDVLAFDADLATLAAADPTRSEDHAVENARARALGVTLAGQRATLFPPPRTP